MNSTRCPAFLNCPTIDEKQTRTDPFRCKRSLTHYLQRLPHDVVSETHPFVVLSEIRKRAEELHLLVSCE
jgi:hypothetical protein